MAEPIKPKMPTNPTGANRPSDPPLTDAQRESLQAARDARLRVKEEEAGAPAGKKRGGSIKKYARGGGIEQRGKTKARHFDDGGDVERKDFYSGFTVDKDYPDNKEKSTPKATPKAERKNFSDETDAGPKEDTSAVSGRADPMSKRMPSDEQKEKNAENLGRVLSAIPLARGVQAVGKVGAPSRVAGQTYAERKAFLKQSEKEYNKLRGDLDAGVKKPEGFSNLYGKRNFTGKEATEANTKRFNEKGYAKGGAIRGGGIESRGKTKGRFV